VREAAQAAVERALLDHSTQLDPAAAAALGAVEVSTVEVRAALKSTAPGRSPGVDSLAAESYRQHPLHTEPLLSRLSSAIGRTGDTPVVFLLGAITFIYKKGPKTHPANYRPTTLLNSDYRCLTRALATRLGPVLGKAIGLEQSAFLPKRKIGEAVWLLQLLPELLRQMNQEASVVFMDFAKAYDTVSRSFLLASMETLGAGEGLLKWTRTPLTDIRAVPVLKGHVSDPVESRPVSARAARYPPTSTSSSPRPYWLG
jgi:hypothetical protein